jgi:2-dehydropantoate 2-reductase
MKILVLGAGAIGGYYGARLRDAGADVTFLVRERRSKQLSQQGLVVKSSLGDYSDHVPTMVAGEPLTGVDIVLLTCKAYDLEGACASVRPYLGKGTLIYPLLNGMLTYDWLDQEFGQERVLGGVAYIATTLMQNGEIEHMGANDTIIVGARDDGQATAGRQLYELFAKSKGVRTWSDDIEQDLWEKWVMVATGGIITCLMRGVIGDVLATDDGEKLVRQAIAESASVSKAAGHELRASAVAAANRILLDTASRWGSSMMRDIEQGAAKIEGDQIVGDLVRRAAAFGLDVPLMRAAYCHLQVYQQRHGS